LIALSQAGPNKSRSWVRWKHLVLEYYKVVWKTSKLRERRSCVFLERTDGGSD